MRKLEKEERSQRNKTLTLNAEEMECLARDLKSAEPGMLSNQIKNQIFHAKVTFHLLIFQSLVAFAFLTACILHI